MQDNGTDRDDKRAGVQREKVKPGIWKRRSAKGKDVFEITYRDSDGRQRRQTVVGGQRKAEEALRKVKVSMDDGQRVAPNPRLTFKAASERWLAAKSPNLSPKTITMYRYGLDVHLLPAFGNKRMDNINVTMVSAFIAKMATAEYRREVERRVGREPVATEGYAIETIKSVLIPLSRTFAYAKRNLGYAGENVVAALEADEQPGYKKRRAKKKKLNREQLDKLVEAAESPWREIIATAAALGTRLGETLGLRWQDVDLDHNMVSIEQQATAKGEQAQLKTETSERKIEAPAWLVSMLREIKLASPYSADDDLVFCTRTGRAHGHGNVLGRGLYPALDRAGLPQTSFHSLRHTHASLWIKDGGDAVTLSKRLGHATPQVTMTTYADEIEEANDNAVRQARVDAMYSQTKMAALMAATEGSSAQQTDDERGGEVLSLSDGRGRQQQAADAAG